MNGLFFSNKEFQTNRAAVKKKTLRYIWNEQSQYAIFLL